MKFLYDSNINLKYKITYKFMNFTLIINSYIIGLEVI